MILYDSLAFGGGFSVLVDVGTELEETVVPEFLRVGTRAAPTYEIRSQSLRLYDGSEGESKIDLKSSDLVGKDKEWNED